MSAPIQIVDEHDRPVRAATKQEAWRHGLWHRVVRVMLDDGQGRILLQHRSPTKDLYPDRWDASVSGHVDAGETYLSAALRELQEEVGVRGIALHEIGSYRAEDVSGDKHMKRFERVYAGTIAGPVETNEPDKLDAVQWFSVDEIQFMIAEDASQCSPGLQTVMKRYY